MVSPLFCLVLPRHYYLQKRDQKYFRGFATFLKGPALSVILIRRGFIPFEQITSLNNKCMPQAKKSQLRFGGLTLARKQCNFSLQHFGKCFRMEQLWLNYLPIRNLVYWMDEIDRSLKFVKILTLPGFKRPVNTPII